CCPEPARGHATAAPPPKASIRKSRRVNESLQCQEEQKVLHHAISDHEKPGPTNTCRVGTRSHASAEFFPILAPILQARLGRKGGVQPRIETSGHFHISPVVQI